MATILKKVCGEHWVTLHACCNSRWQHCLSDYLSKCCMMMWSSKWVFFMDSSSSLVPCPTAILASRRPGRRQTKCVRILTHFAKSQSQCSYPLFLLVYKRSVHGFHIAVCKRCVACAQTFCKMSQDSDTFCLASTWPMTGQYRSRTGNQANLPLVWHGGPQGKMQRYPVWNSGPHWFRIFPVMLPSDHSLIDDNVENLLIMLIPPLRPGRFKRGGLKFDIGA